MPTTVKRHRKPSSEVSSPEPRLDAAFRLVMKLMAIPGTCGQEGAAAQFVIDQLLAADAARSAIRFDDAHRKSPLKGEVGNLYILVSRHGAWNG